MRQVEMGPVPQVAEELSGRAVFDSPWPLCLLMGERREGEQARPGLDTEHERRVREPGSALSARGSEAAHWVSSIKKGARGGGAGPAPSPGGRGRETLRGGSGGRERQLSGHRGPGCTCCPTEVEEAAGAVTV